MSLAEYPHPGPVEARRIADATARKKRASLRQLRLELEARDEKRRIAQLEKNVPGIEKIIPHQDPQEVTQMTDRDQAREVSKLTNGTHGRPSLDEQSHIASEWDGSRHLIEDTPKDDAEFDLAWTEAPIVMKEGVIVEFGVSEVEDSNSPFSKLAQSEEEDLDIYFDIDRVEERSHEPAEIASLEDLQVASEVLQNGRLPGALHDYGITQIDQFE